MSVKIASNTTSLNVQRNLGDACTHLSKSMERLSSGLRINKAADDAAGLAISESLTSSSRVYSTAIRNVNDGLSFLNIADGALAELSNITSRQLELSQQAANGCYSKTQRQALNDEANALVKEYNRIIKTTSFNGSKVLDVEASSGMVRIQAGYGINGSLGISLGAELSRVTGTGNFGTLVQYSSENSYTNDMQLADIDNDGDLDMVTTGNDIGGGVASVRKNNGDGTFAAAVNYASEVNMSNALQLADIDNDGDLDMVTAGFGGGGQVTVRKNNGSGTFGAATQYASEDGPTFGLQLADIDNDGDLDMVTGGYGSNTGLATIRKNNGDGTFGAAVQYSTEGAATYGLQLADIDNDGDLDILTAGYTGFSSGQASVRLNKGDGTFGSLVHYTTEGWQSFKLRLADIDNDGDLDMVTAGETDIGGFNYKGFATVRKNNGDGTFGSAIQYSTDASVSTALQLADIDNDGDLDMITAGNGSQGSASIRMNNGDGAFGALVQFTTESSSSNALQLADINNDKVLDLVTGGSDGTYDQISIRKGIGHNVTSIASLNLCTQRSAREALTTLKAQLDRISAERGSIGSAQSRLSVALNTLGTTKENFDAAASRITDVDVAQESADMTRSEIIQRVGASILANANQAPQIALTLLR